MTQPTNIMYGNRKLCGNPKTCDELTKRVLELEEKLDAKTAQYAVEREDYQRRIAELEADADRFRSHCMVEERVGAAESVLHVLAAAGYHERLAGIRGLIAECLALNPAVTGDMEKVRVWADVVERMRKEAGRE